MTTENSLAGNMNEISEAEDSYGGDTFARLFGDSLGDFLDAESWTPGADLANTYARLEREVRLSVDRERKVASTIREKLFPRIEASALAGPESGVYGATPAQISKVHDRLLLNGSVEACAGISMKHESLAMILIQIGVCLVAYQGDQQAWSQRMFRRDYRADGSDRITEMLSVLDKRRANRDGESASDRISRLARRGIQAYAERMFLTRHTSARWRMCEGMPAPFELVSGAGLVSAGSAGMTYPLMEAGMEILRELLLKHRRFVFVPRRRQDMSLLTIGQALAPLEYAVIDTISDQIESVERTGHYDDNQREVIARFRRDVGEVVVRGVFRASSMGPPQVFYAHRDHVHGAALIAMADSVLQEQRSYPILLDLARTVCETTFGIDSFAPQLRVAYTDAGEPWTAI
ncbi:MAG: hypothetical protein F4X34_04240 [Chloroflexi bacterium]|nr:hypothetical protein [Chloroflexota bacterium]